MSQSQSQRIAVLVAVWVVVVVACALIAQNAVLLVPLAGVVPFGVALSVAREGARRP